MHMFSDIKLDFFSERQKNNISYVSASSHGDRLGNPISDVGHRIATGITFSVAHEKQHLHIHKINSKEKGMGTKMVDAVVGCYPDCTISVIDRSRRRGDNGPTFWDKMKTRHPKIEIKQTPPSTTLPKINHAISIFRYTSTIRRF